MSKRYAKQQERTVLKKDGSAIKETHAVMRKRHNVVIRVRNANRNANVVLK